MSSRIDVVVEGEMHHAFVDMARRRKCPIPTAVRRGPEPYLGDPELEGLARGGSGTAQHKSLAP